MFFQRTACRRAATLRHFSSGKRLEIGTDHDAQRAQRHPRSAKARLNRSPLLSLLGVTAAVGVCLGANYYLLGLGSPPPFDSFDAQKFTKCKIVDKVPVSSTAYIYTIKPPSAPSSKTSSKAAADVYRQYWEQGLWSLEFKQPALQIARSYTPLPPKEGENEGELRFLIRRLRGGEMSNYLSRLSVNDEVEVRGPGIEYVMTEEDRRGNTDIVFLAGGTGISSALQAVHCFLGYGGVGDRIRILWANRRREDCEGAPRSVKPAGLMGGLFGAGQEEKAEVEQPGNAIMQEIRELQRKYHGRVEVQYFVDEEGTFITPKTIKDTIRVVDEPGRRRLLMTSGPDGFMEYFVGKKGDWVGTQQMQGKVGGVVRQLGLKGWEVVKL